MQRTLYNTPIVTPLLRALSAAWLRLAGWTVEGALPAGAERCVLIGAPHTSNWDLPNALMIALVLRLDLCWMGKASIFRWPFGGFMRWMGGLPVDRARSRNLVAASAQALREADGPLQLGVAPEGTRARAERWKTGFYFIALEAGVPVVPAYMDYGRMRSGLGPAFHPSGDVDADIARMRAFFADMRGRNPDQFAAG